MENILLHVYYSGKPGQAKAFAVEMQQGLRNHVLKEAGCLQYDYFIPNGDDSKVLLIERWEDQSALDQHANGSVIKQLKVIKAKYELDTRIERFE